MDTYMVGLELRLISLDTWRKHQRQQQPSTDPDKFGSRFWMSVLLSQTKLQHGIFTVSSHNPSA